MHPSVVYCFHKNKLKHFLNDQLETVCLIVEVAMHLIFLFITYLCPSKLRIRNNPPYITNVGKNEKSVFRFSTFWSKSVQFSSEFLQKMEHCYQCSAPFYSRNSQTGRQMYGVTFLYEGRTKTSCQNSILLQTPPLGLLLQGDSLSSLFMGTSK